MDLYINEYGSRINLNNGVITISKEGKILKVTSKNHRLKP